MSRISEACRRAVAGCASVAAGALLCAALPLRAQDLTAPPRIDATEAEPSGESSEVMEEIVVVSDQNPWRLPDLGSEWRAAQEEQAETGRISVELLNLWDPEAEDYPRHNPYVVSDGIRRVGFLEVFRVRFGRR